MYSYYESIPIFLKNGEIMFKSKTFIIIIVVLAICLILTGYHMLSHNIDSDSNVENESDDTIMMPIQDENGSVRLVPVTDTKDEFSASAP